MNNGIGKSVIDDVYGIQTTVTDKEAFIRYDLGIPKLELDWMGLLVSTSSPWVRRRQTICMWSETWNIILKSAYNIYMIC
jgi:hypothetical protein